MSGLVGGCVLLVAGVAGLTACAPSFTYSADYNDHAYFKVPYAWHQLKQTDVSAALKAVGWSSAGWTSAFDAGASPTADNFLSFATQSPFVFSEVGTLTSSASSGLSYNTLIDAFLPVSSTMRGQLPSSYPLTNFQLLGQSKLTPGLGVHGIKETYNWTYGGLISDTFEQVALTNSTDTQFYLLVLHCSDSCFAKNQKAIDTVISSFTVRSP
jgi:hypothetical protein